VTQKNESRDIKWLYIYSMHMSDKVKQHLIKKLEECQQKLNKLKRKRKIIKKLYILTMLLSIVTSTVVAVLSSVAIVPFVIIPIMSSISAILTGISARFNFHDKKSEIKGLINKFNKIKGKLDYLIAFNGDLTQAEYEEILNNF
jgi:nitrogen fixation/metabolism regulation signal transduction histidine kinase